MKNNWRHEFARDSLAFGSILFYFIVIIRAIIGDYMPFVYQLLVALVIIYILSFVVKKANRHIARAAPLVVFTSIFYKDNLYTTFAFLLWVFMILAAVYIRESKRGIIKGIIFGIIASFFSYYLTSLFV